MKRLHLINGIEWHLRKIGRVWHAWRWVGGKMVTRTTRSTTQEGALDVIQGWAEPTRIHLLGPVAGTLLDSWVQRQIKRRGAPLANQTVYEHELHLERHILPQFGEWELGDIGSDEIDEWIYQVEVSNRYRRSILGTLKIVLTEALRRKLITSVPPIEMPSAESRKPLPFEEAQIGLLFSSPDLWRREHEPDWVATMLMSLFAAMVFGGLRPQEARALHADQVIPDLHAILITRQITGKKTVSMYLKTGGIRDPKYRGTLLSDRGWAVFYAWAKTVEDGPLYTLDGILSGQFIGKRLRDTCRVAGFTGRHTPYSGRYTFVTRYKPVLDPATLMTLTGHVDPAMPERYNVPHLLEQMKQIQGVRETLDEADGRL